MNEDEEALLAAAKEYVTHDSGEKAEYEDGMRRDTTKGKPKFGLMFPKGVPYEEQLITRVAALYERGGQKYGDRNWEKSSSEESLAHHEEALWRHVVKFFLGIDDGEDHAAAIVWNVNAVELTRRNMTRQQTVHSSRPVASPCFSCGEFRCGRGQSLCFECRENEMRDQTAHSSPPQQDPELVPPGLTEPSSCWENSPQQNRLQSDPKIYYIDDNNLRLMIDWGLKTWSLGTIDDYRG